MKNIEHLPEDVHTWLRSSTVLVDLPRVVEELVFNSLESGATKVYILVNIDACYVKVEDDGCGITRDGLVLIGERHASSKLDQLADMDNISENMGFNGEVLGSLSDVSVVEIRTKARGKPNGYCKIIKGWKCLFLGIDDQRQTVGTTVIVRDLFYNQPVRRKQMYRSRRSMLNSVKKCVLRSALVYPQVCFSFIDIESKDELLRTIPSMSPLQLIRDTFGENVSSSLHSVSFVDKAFKLSGYLSVPTAVFSTKVFQYLYINSRFVCSGPIHNLLNNLVMNTECSPTLRKVQVGIDRGKRQRTQGYPAYMLNLLCPITTYNITFETSKTVVEFKNWPTVLDFFEHAIIHFWKALPVSLEGNIFPAHQVKAIRTGLLDDAEPRKKEPSKREMSKNSWTTKRKNEFDCTSSLISSAKVKSQKISHTHGTSPIQKNALLPELAPCRRKNTFAPKPDSSVQDARYDEHDVFRSTNAEMSVAVVDPHSFIMRDLFPSDQAASADNILDIPGSVCKHKHYDNSENFDDEPACQTVHNPFSCENIADDDPFRLTHLNLSYKPYSRSTSLTEDDLSFFSLHNGFRFSDDEFRPQLPCFVNSNMVHFNCEKISFDNHSKCVVPSAPARILTNHSMDFDISFDSSMLPFHDRMSITNESGLRPGHTMAERESTLDVAYTGEVDILGSRHCSPYQFVSLKGSSTPVHVSESCLFRSTRHYDCRKYEPNEPISQLSEDLDTEDYAFHGKLPIASPRESLLVHIDCEPLDNCARQQLPYHDLFQEKGYDFGDLSGKTYLLPANSQSMDQRERESLLSEFPALEQNHRVDESHHKEKKFGNHNDLSYVQNTRSRRSSSAPPFYRGKQRFSTLNDQLTRRSGKQISLNYTRGARTSPETTFFGYELSQPCAASQNSEATFDSTPQQYLTKIGTKPNTDNINWDQRNQELLKASCMPGSSSLECFVNDSQEFVTGTTLTKWRNNNMKPTVEEIPTSSSSNQDDILDIYSGILNLTSAPLVPKFISRDSLQDARVLLQVDKKFIPLVARGILVILDQHAADERIRLEDLRQKVLCGEGRSTTYLEYEQDLVISENMFQLLQKYKEQINHWGWICSIDIKCSESFAKNLSYLKKQSHNVTLVAVPCVLGINLSEKDLTEFLEQLAETDGSSTFPPAALRILNFKACRGAIMFGDPLLPSECSLILEELKSTSLCFQCAHGRPTAVPLLDMVALHEQLSKLDRRTLRPQLKWHGFGRKRTSLERAQQRLASAKRFHKG